MAGRLLPILSFWNGPFFWGHVKLAFRGVWHPWKSNWMRNLKWFQVWFRFHVELWGETIKWSCQTWAVNHFYADEHSHILIKTHEVLSACQPLILLMFGNSKANHLGCIGFQLPFPQLVSSPDFWLPSSTRRRSPIVDTICYICSYRSLEGIFYLHEWLIFMLDVMV